jgi:hypothetical protein
MAVSVGQEQAPTGSSPSGHRGNEISGVFRTIFSPANEEADAPKRVPGPRRDQRPLDGFTGFSRRLGSSRSFRLGILETLSIGALQGAGYGAGCIHCKTVPPIVTILGDYIARGLPESNLSERVCVGLSGAMGQR